MSERKGLLNSGLGMVLRNKRYIFWFWLLNLTLAEFGTSAFRKSAHAILDHSLAGGRLVHGFDVTRMFDLFVRPEFGSMTAMSTPALYFGFLFLLATALFLPGIFQGYASTYRLPREDFFRTCGRNLWRYIRLMWIAGILMGIATGALFALHGVLERKAAESTNELLLPEVQFIGLFIIFLIMTVFRIWFDLAEADIVLNDQRAVRKSIGAGFRHTFRGFFRLLASYVVAALVAAIILVGGIWMWMKFVSPESVAGAFLIGQLTLILLLIPRFWQRGVAVSYWQQRMLVPVAVVEPVLPQPVPAAVATPIIPPISPPPTPEGA
jgi:hypothetical protein